MVRWTRFVTEHRKRVLLAWLVCVLVAGAAASGLSGLLSNRFSLPGSDGRTYRLKELAGRPVVLAWFPKAFTGG